MSIKDNANFLLLESYYPRISKNIELLWDTALGLEYLHNLIYDTRENTRQGFPKIVIDAIITLYEMHKRKFPQFNKPEKPTTGWFTFR